MIKKKKFLLLLVAMIMLISFNTSTLAKSTYEIDNLKELKKEIQQITTDELNKKSKKLADSKRRDLREKTNPNVLKKYAELLVKDLEELNQNVSSVLSVGDTEVVYELPNTGAKVTIETTNTIIENDTVTLEPINSPEPTFTTLATVSRPFGSHAYTIKYKIHATTWPDSTAALVTFYKVDATGLTATSSSISGTMGLYPTSVEGTSKLTDTRAEKVGYDINSQGDYRVSIGYGPAEFVTYNMSIMATMKWNAAGITAQSVAQSYSVYK